MQVSKESGTTNPVGSVKIVEDRSRDGVRVRTSVHDGRKYVNSNELIESEKAGRQIEQLLKHLKSHS